MITLDLFNNEIQEDALRCAKAAKTELQTHPDTTIKMECVDREEAEQFHQVFRKELGEEFMPRVFFSWLEFTIKQTEANQ